MINIPMNVIGAMGTNQLNTTSFARKTKNPYDVTSLLRGVINQSQGFKGPTGSMGFSNTAPQQNYVAPQQNYVAPQQNYVAPQQNFGGQPNFGQQSPVNTPQNTGFNSQPQQYQPRQRTFGNGVQLRKGQKQSLSQLCPGLDLIQVGLGWDLGPNGQGYDLDVDAFMLGANGKVIGDDWFVFYNQPESPDQSVRLLCDSTTGAGAGDDEIVQVQLSKVNPQVTKIVFIVSINEAKQYGYNFSNVANAYVRITDVKTNNELARFQLTDYYSNVNSMVVGEVYRHNGEWKFNAVGDGVSADLMDLCLRYGVNVA